MVLLANGVRLPLPLRDAYDVAEMLVRTGRAVPADEWIDAFVERSMTAAAAAETAKLPHTRV